MLEETSEMLDIKSILSKSSDHVQTQRTVGVGCEAGTTLEVGRAARRVLWSLQSWHPSLLGPSGSSVGSGQWVSALPGSSQHPWVGADLTRSPIFIKQGSWALNSCEKKKKNCLGIELSGYNLQTLASGKWPCRTPHSWKKQTLKHFHKSRKYYHPRDRHHKDSVRICGWLDFIKWRPSNRRPVCGVEAWLYF